MIGEAKQKKYRIYKIFCACICLVLWLLSYFQGHIYLSANGYAILKDELITPFKLNDNGSVKYYITHEVIINGDHVYFTYNGEEEYLQHVPEETLQFDASSDEHGFTDFYIFKENKKFHYNVIYHAWRKDSEEMRIRYQKHMYMLCDFITANWSNFYIFGHVLMNGGHAGLTIFFAVLVILLQIACLYLIKSRMQKGRKHDMLCQIICCTVFGCLQLGVLVAAILHYITFC